MDTTTLPRLGDITTDQYRQHLSFDYTRWLSCLTEASFPQQASRMFLGRYPHSLGAGLLRKAAVTPGTTTDATWAQPLVAVQPLADAFVAIARSKSLLGRIPGLRKIPFGAQVPFETAGANYVWVAENAPKPASVMAFSTGVTLTPTKCLGVIVVTRELVELSGPGMEGALRDTLMNGLVSFTDRQFLDPTVAAVAGKNPASVTNGTTPITATASYATDVQSLLTAFFTARPNAQDAVLIANAGHAAQLRTLNAGGGPGLPVLVSDAAAGHTIALDGAGVFVADGGVTIDISREASLQMNDAPDNPVTAATVQVSLWQQNLRGFRVERFVNWAAVPGAVKYLAG